MNGLELRDIHKSYNTTRALQGVSISVTQGEIVAVLGPSGCGKSTLLGIIAGLIPPDKGEVLWDRSDIKDIPPHRRGFGLMFQDLALFPHRNVYNNIAFGLQMSRLPDEQVKARVIEVLELIGLPGIQLRDVNTLSGGESQRVALGRALAPHPRLVMLDEPLGSLDRNLRERLTLELRLILQRSQQTALYVTHDQEEAFMIADQVVIMNQGNIVQSGTPEELYHQPRSEFVARFLNLNNLLPGEVLSSSSGLLVHTPIGDFPVSNVTPGKHLTLIRPDTAQPFPGKACQVTGVVMEDSFRGSQRRAEITVNSYRLSFDFPSHARLPTRGEMLTLSFDPGETVQILDHQTCPVNRIADD